MELLNLGHYSGPGKMWPSNSPHVEGSFNGLASGETIAAGGVLKESSTNGYLGAASNSCDILGVAADEALTAIAVDGALRPRVYVCEPTDLFVFGVGNGTLAVTDVHKKCDVYQTSSGVTTIDLADTSKGNIHIVGVDLVRDRVLVRVTTTFTDRP